MLTELNISDHSEIFSSSASILEQLLVYFDLALRSNQIVCISVVLFDFVILTGVNFLLISPIPPCMTKLLGCLSSLSLDLERRRGISVASRVLSVELRPRADPCSDGVMKSDERRRRIAG